MNTFKHGFTVGSSREAKVAALARLAEIETEAEVLRKFIETPAASLLTRPGDGELHCIVATMGGFSVSTKLRVAGEGSDGNLFQTEYLAKTYAEALNTMLLLRHQPGTVPANDENQFIIIITRECGVTYTGLGDAEFKAGGTSPCFSLEEDAQRAIDTIGSARIARMFRALSHIGSDQ
jgi:hypothetical protein